MVARTHFRFHFNLSCSITLLQFHRLNHLLSSQTAADAKFHWIRKEGDVQLSTASLLMEAPSNKGSPVL